jgi:hypothetical protein
MYWCLESNILAVHIKIMYKITINSYKQSLEIYIIRTYFPSYIYSIYFLINWWNTEITIIKIIILWGIKVIKEKEYNKFPSSTSHKRKNMYMPCMAQAQSWLATIREMRFWTSSTTFKIQMRYQYIWIWEQNDAVWAAY